MILQGAGDDLGGGSRAAVDQHDDRLALGQVARTRRVALRLTTARYFTPSGKSIQAKGIVPDIEVLQDVPDELKSRTDTKGEASLRGHLKNDGDEKTGSQSYVPPDAKDDKALKTAADLLHGIKSTATAAPATGDKAAIDKPATKAAN